MNDQSHRLFSEDYAGGTTARGTRTPDTRWLLAVLSARQRIQPTAKAMRHASSNWPSDSAPDCMVRLFAGKTPLQGLWGGSFNRGAAHYLSAGDGEKDVYLGA